MTLAVARRDRETPHHREHDSSVSARMERGKMPGSLDGLVRWYMGMWSDETPARLHKRELWHDQVTQHEREEGIAPMGGSLTGTLAWDATFRVVLENSPSIIDQDGYYRLPLRSALSRLHRRRPLMARNLFSLGMAGGDWRRLGDANGWAQEMYEVYIEEALRRLWIGTYDRVTVGMA